MRITRFTACKAYFLLLTCAFILLILGFVHVNVNSDVLYIEVFHQDYIRDISLGDRWYQMPAPAYFPDQLVYFIARLFLPISTALFIVAAVKVLLLTFVMYFFCRYALELKRVKSYSFAFVTTVILISPHRAGVGSYPLFQIQNNHFVSVLIALLMVTLLLKPIEKYKISIISTAFFLGLIAALSSPASVLIIGLLCLSMLLVTRWKLIQPLPLRECLPKYRTLLLKTEVTTFIVLSLGLILGYLLYTQYINPNYLGIRLWGLYNDFLPDRGGIDNLKNSLRFLRERSYKTIPYSPTTLLVIISSLFLINKNSSSSRFKTINIALLIAFPLTFLAFAVGGGITDVGFQRYFYQLQIVLILNVLYGMHHYQSTYLNRLMLFIAILSILAYKNDFRIDGSQFNASLEVPEESKQLASCINENIQPGDSEERVFIGVINYWNANPTRVQVPDKKIDILNLSHGGGARMWMQNIPLSDSIIDRFYLAVKNDEKNLFPITSQAALSCSGNQWSLLDYGSDKQLAVDFVKSLSSHLSSRLEIHTPKGLWFGNWLPSTAEHQKANYASKSQGPGYAHFGPYVTLKEGFYYSEIFYSLQSSSLNNKVKLEVGCLNKEEVFHEIATTELSQGYGLTAKIDFAASRADNCSHGYEIRTWIDEGDIMYLNHLTIAKVFPYLE